MASSFATRNLSDKWLVDNGYTNHMTFDRDLFKELDTLCNTLKYTLSVFEHV